MIAFANAKINLGLHVTSKREDGYHAIESLMYPIPLYDIIEYRPARSFRIIIQGIDIATSMTENLVYRAWLLARERWHIEPLEVQLLKNIPPRSGLGGGSSDAVFFLKALMETYQISEAPGVVKEMALQIGSDCPFFVDNIPALVTGRGESTEPCNISLSGKWLLVRHAGPGTSTEQAYRNVSVNPNRLPLSEILKQHMHEWRENLVNDFEKNAMMRQPDLKNIKNELYQAGAFYVSLTGSGSAVYALFDREPVIDDERGFLLSTML